MMLTAISTEAEKKVKAQPLASPFFGFDSC